jgi:LEA14-like dessication related protein
MGKKKVKQIMVNTIKEYIKHHLYNGEKIIKYEDLPYSKILSSGYDSICDALEELTKEGIAMVDKSDINNINIVPGKVIKRENKLNQILK